MEPFHAHTKCSHHDICNSNNILCSFYDDDDDDDDYYVRLKKDCFTKKKATSLLLDLDWMEIENSCTQCLLLVMMMMITMRCIKGLCPSSSSQLKYNKFFFPFSFFVALFLKPARLKFKVLPQ